MNQLFTDVVATWRRRPRRGDLSPQGIELPEMSRDRRRRRTGRARPRKHRRQCPARLPGRLVARARQGRQGKLSRAGRRDQRRQGLHRHQAPPDRFRAGLARRRGPRDRDSDELDRGTKEGRLAHAGGLDRWLDPARADRPGSISVASWARSGLTPWGPTACCGAGRSSRKLPEAKSAGRSQTASRRLLAKEPGLTWRPAYTTVAGLLSLSEWPDADRHRHSGSAWHWRAASSKSRLPGR